MRVILLNCCQHEETVFVGLVYRMMLMCRISPVLPNPPPVSPHYDPEHRRAKAETCVSSQSRLCCTTHSEESAIRPLTHTWAHKLTWLTGIAYRALYNAGLNVNNLYLYSKWKHSSIFWISLVFRKAINLGTFIQKYPENKALIFGDVH